MRVVAMPALGMVSPQRDEEPGRALRPNRGDLRRRHRRDRGGHATAGREGDMEGDYLYASEEQSGPRNASEYKERPSARYLDDPEALATQSADVAARDSKCARAAKPLNLSHNRLSLALA